MNLLAATQERPGFSPGLVLFKDHRYPKVGQPEQHLCVGNPSQAPEVRSTSNLWMAADGPVFNRHKCRCPAKKSALTGQHKCHIHPMENVTLTQKEQARLQVSNSLLAEHMTLDQAATLMGVSERHIPGASWRLTGRREPPPLLTATEATRRPTRHPMPW